MHAGAQRTSSEPRTPFCPAAWDRVAGVLDRRRKFAGDHGGGEQAHGELEIYGLDSLYRRRGINVVEISHSEEGWPFSKDTPAVFMHGDAPKLGGVPKDVCRAGRMPEMRFGRCQVS